MNNGVETCNFLKLLITKLYVDDIFNKLWILFFYKMENIGICSVF